MNFLKKVKYLLVIFCCLNSPLLFAQQSDVGNWFNYFGNQGIGGKWNWHNEIQYRNYNFAGDLQQLLLRTGIGYNITEQNNNLLLGYGFIHSQPYMSGADEKINVNEHRIFQQFINRHQIGRVFLQHRVRLEERFIPADFQLRSRYFLGINIPFNHEAVTANTIYFSAYNETFINARQPAFDRNRIYGALGYGISKQIRAEAGFMTQILKNSHRNQFQIVLFNNIPISNN